MRLRRCSYGDDRTIVCQQPGEIMPNDTPSSHPLLSCTDRFAVAWQDFLILFGRILLGWIFMQSAWRKFGDMPAFIKSSLTDRGVPVAYGDLLGYIAAPAEFIGGVCILLGLATRYAAILTFVFIIIATLIGHRYWDFTGAQYRAQHTQFWKNVSMMGGQVLLFVTAGGRFSLDALLRRK
jgi:putative oxidoreductase